MTRLVVEPDASASPVGCTHRCRAGRLWGTAWLVLLTWSATAPAQQNQFGGQDRADAARRMIVLGVQQGIDALPPPSGQAFTYEFDPAKDTFVRGQRMGPTAFRAVEPVGAGRFSFRLSASYFELSDSFGPITYFIEPTNPALSSPKGYAQFGLSADAKVEVTSFTLNYGIGNRFEVIFNLPIVVVDAQASQSYTTRADNADPKKVPPKQAVLSGGRTVAELDSLLKSGRVVFRSDRFSDLGFQFNDGTHVGVGRISLGAKGVAYKAKYLQLALSTELFMPSPNEDEFAGSATGAILPRAIAAVPVAPLLKLRLDAGYDYDFDSAELRRFVWNAGASVPMQRASFDVGVGGSDYDQAIRWTPSVAHGIANSTFPATTLTAQNDNRLETDFVDFLFGVKVRITGPWVLSGAVTVPLNGGGFRPAAAGTGAVEVYF